MKILFTAILLFVLSTCSFAQAEKDTIYWSPCYKLKWEDFKGSPDTTLQYEALTFSGIECKYTFTDTSFTHNVAAFFIRKQSWKMSWADNIALKHEQVHFDISEVFARRLKNELAKLKPNRETVKKIVADLVKKIIDEKEDMQNQYDEETNFGRKNSLQQKWQQKIKMLLQKNK